MLAAANTSKPLVIDDPVYVAYAPQIQQRPGDPDAFELYGYDAPEPAMRIGSVPAVPWSTTPSCDSGSVPLRRLPVAQGVAVLYRAVADIDPQRGAPASDPGAGPRGRRRGGRAPTGRLSA